MSDEYTLFVYPDGPQLKITVAELDIATEIPRSPGLAADVEQAAAAAIEANTGQTAGSYTLTVYRR